MAIGFPTKANWAAGDVLTASVMDDLAGTVNLISNASATSGSQLLSNAAGTSFAYSATPSASNPILNSSMQIFQRSSTPTTGITVTSGNAYTLDRWNSWTLSAGGSVTTSRQITGDTTNLPNIQYCARFQRVAGNTNTGALVLGQALETINSIPYVGKTVTISFYARKGADYSAASAGLIIQLWSNTTTDGSLQTVFTGSANAVAGAATLTATWQRFSFTGAVSSIATQIAPAFLFTPVGTALTNDYCEITGVQIDIGSVALPFRTYAATYQQELAACQRYLPAFIGGYDHILGYAYSTTGTQIYVKYPTTARVAPSGMIVNPTLSGNYVLINQGFTNGTPTAIAWNTGGTNYASLNITTTAGSPTLIAGQPATFNIFPNGYILFTGCEL